MTLYTGQGLTNIIPLESEHTDGRLLFTEHDRRNAYSFLEGKPCIPTRNIIEAKETVSRLMEIVDANESHQAEYFIERLLQKAQEQGVDLIPQVEIQSVIE